MISSPRQRVRGHSPSECVDTLQAVCGHSPTSVCAHSSMRTLQLRASTPDQICVPWDKLSFARQFNETSIGLFNIVGEFTIEVKAPIQPTPLHFF